MSEHEVHRQSAMFTGSTWNRVDRCPVSAVLPGQVRSESERADLGSAMHEHMALRSTVGVAVATEQLDATARRWGLDEKATSILKARCMHFEWSPPKGAIAEMPLCLLDDGSVQVVDGGKGRYSNLPPGGFFALTLDTIWAEPARLVIAECEGCGMPTAGRCRACGIMAAPPRCPEGSTLWVVDYKTGMEKHVAAAEHNDQVLAGALLAARWTGAKTVLPAILYPRKGQGMWDVPDASFLVDDLASVETRLRDARRRVLEQEAKLARGERPDFVTGGHCEFCPAETRCGAKVAMMKAFIARGVPDAEMLTEDDWQVFAETIPQIERFVERSKALMKKHVDATGRPIPLRKGRVWGPHEVQKTRILPKVALPILAAEVGPKLAQEAVIESLSREAVEAAVAASHQERGIFRKVAPTMRQIMGLVGARGGLLSETRVEYSAYAPITAPQAASVTGGEFVDIPIDDGD